MIDPAIAAALQTIERNRLTWAVVYPHDATEHGAYPFRQARRGYPPGSHTGWTTGFWPGMLWLAYELSGDEAARAAGEIQVQRFADRLERQVDIDHHDLGFLYSLSCVAAWRLVRSELGCVTASRAADHLMTRFLPGAGILQAWGALDDPDQRGRAIVDSLMNLPLLFWASQQTGKQVYADAAIRHAEQLMRHIVRPDGSTYHTFYFDVDSGAPLRGCTHQGHRDESTWSRGQAWATYGFALSYRYTGDPRFKSVAERCADVFVAHTPSDGVVYWDFDFSEGSREPRDSSASAIAACGLLELGRNARDIVHALWQTCAPRDSSGSNALLLHGTQNRNTGAGVDEGNLWGDYFYLEALTRLARATWSPYW
jgi:unsaturated chondroitin disaccharide hydrolase